MSAPRVAVLTNGNHFANLVLTPLLWRTDLDLLVVVTTGLRKQRGNRAVEAWSLLRRWGPRYAAYKVGTYAVPALAEALGRRPQFVLSTCREAGVRVEVARNVNDVEVVEVLRRFAPDVLVSVSCPYRVGEQLLALPRAGALNVHSSLLPAYAGIGTYVHVLAAGEPVTGVTVHEMVERFDAGRIVGQRSIRIPDGLSVYGLFSAQCRVAADLLTEAVDRALEQGDVGGVPQDQAARTYFGEPTRLEVDRARRRGHPLVRMRELSGLLARDEVA